MLVTGLVCRITVKSLSTLIVESYIILLVEISFARDLAN